MSVSLILRSRTGGVSKDEAAKPSRPSWFETAFGVLTMRHNLILELVEGWSQKPGVRQRYIFLCV
jgi:hypothetical protein